MLDAVKVGGTAARLPKICGPQIFVIQQPNMFLSNANGTANAGKSTIVFTNSVNTSSNSNVRSILSLASNSSVPKVQVIFLLINPGHLGAVAHNFTPINLS